MIVLDTNVISEVLKPQPSPRVVAWLHQVGEQTVITAVTLAELLAGLRRLPDGKRKTLLHQKVESALLPFRGTQAILPFDEQAAPQYADVLTRRAAAGLPIATADAQIAAICLASHAVLATRNVPDFVVTGVEVVDPWSGEQQAPLP